MINFSLSKPEKPVTYALTLSRQIGLPPYTPVAQKIADQL